jgi:predicted transcriptional regulator
MNIIWSAKFMANNTIINYVYAQRMQMSRLPMTILMNKEFDNRIVKISYDGHSLLMNPKKNKSKSARLYRQTIKAELLKRNMQCTFYNYLRVKL